MTKENMRNYYQSGLWTKAMVDRLHALGKISDEDYEYILKE